MGAHARSEGFDFPYEAEVRSGLIGSGHLHDDQAFDACVNRLLDDHPTAVEEKYRKARNPVGSNPVGSNPVGRGRRGHTY